jgi:hypothetical protein
MHPPATKEPQTHGSLLIVPATALSLVPSGRQEVGKALSSAKRQRHGDPCTSAKP